MAERTTTVGFRIAQLGALSTALGGLGDVCMWKLLPHHESYLGVAPGAAPPATASLVLLLLHALGVALIAVGIGALQLLAAWRRSRDRSSLIAAAAIVVLAEGMNTFGISRTGSIVFVVPLACLVLVVVGVAMELRASSS